MSEISEKLEIIAEAKEEMKTAIEEKGVEVGDASITEYASKISEIKNDGRSSTNGWEGKVVSILGDSISTFEGYVPVADGHNLTHRIRYNETNAPWFFEEGGTVDDTYWMKLINSLGAKLGINDSWAGSRVSNSKTSNSGDKGPDACMAGITRITNLGANGTPDLILYFGGTNDAGAKVDVGSFDSTITYTTDLTTKTWTDFATAFKDSIMRLQHYYPFAKIVVLLPMYCATYYEMGNLDKYNEQIKAVCDYFGVEYIDFRRCGINFQNLDTMLGDGIHPTVKGFNEMYNYLRNQLLSMYSSDGVENVVYTVTNDLIDCTNKDRYIKGVSHGGSYSATITGGDLSLIKVFMGEANITSTAFDRSTGVVSISDVTDNIVIEETELMTYPITTNVTGGVSSGSTVVTEGSNSIVYILPNGDYTFPATVTVTGASYTYNSETGEVVIFDPTGSVTITAVCEEVPRYTDLQYITASGTTSATFTYAITDPVVAAQDGDVWELDAQSTNSSSSKIGVLLDKDNRGGTWIGQNGGKWAVGGSGFQSTIAATTRANITLTVNDTGVVAIINDGTKSETISREASGDPEQATGYYAIGAMVTNKVRNYGWNGHIFSAKCTRKNGELVANFKPVKRENDSKVGFLETISNTFFPSVQNEFTAGPEDLDGSTDDGGLDW